MTPTENNLSPQDRKELAAELEAAHRRWNIAEDAPAERTIEVLAQAIETDSGLLQDDDVVSAGFLLGEALVKSAGYEWVQLRYSNGLESVAVVEPERRFVCLTLQFVHRSRQDSAALRTLWQVARESAPLGVRPGAYLPLGG